MPSTLRFRPHILGSGGAARAVERALALLQIAHPEWTIEAPRRLPRDARLAATPVDPAVDFLCLANPHALHAPRIVEGAAAGFRRIATEKPLAASLAQLRTLAELPVGVRVAVFHGYRTLWGPQELRRRIVAGELGKILAIEGRYWQSSAAQVGIGERSAKGGWKNDPELSGAHDAALDLATHWVDLATYLAGAPIEGGAVTRSHAHAEAPHRDTHVQLSLRLAGGATSFASISKIAHGSLNDLTVTALGTLGAGTWTFERPDVLVLGRGSESRHVVRPAAVPTATGLPAGHGLGWIDGYAAVLEGFLESWHEDAEVGYPTLAECRQHGEAWLGLLAQG